VPVPDPVPIRCTKCATVLAHDEGGRVRVSEQAVAVGKVVLICTGCGRYRVCRPAQKTQPLDKPKSLRQSGS
jgi:RNase P subunit RPR2